MRLLLDASMSPQVAAELNRLGFDAADSRDFLPTSAPDEDVMAVAWAQDRIVIARDYDMGELAIRKLAPAHGVVIIGFDATIQEEAARIAAELTALGDRVLGCVVVIEPGRVRVPRPIE